jgi:adenosylcobinamide-GDP ribazoletransferase
MLKWSSLYVLLQQQQYWLLIFVPMLGRLSPLFLFLTTPYVRNNGLGKQMMQYFPKKLCLLVFIVSLLFFIWVGQMLAGLLILIFLLALCYLRHKMCQRLGGMTGDTIGASVELIEMLMLLSAVLLFYT